MSLQTGQSLGPYEIVESVGAGGMGEVYRARDTRLGRDVAIKVLPESVRSNPEALARFEREAKAVAALSHPNIMAIHDFGEHEGTAYAVVELLEGETLRDALVPGPLPQRKAIEYARQTARGLGAAHDSGIVHRDLKPENVFVTRDGRIKILDFGLARSTETAEPTDDTPTFTHLTGPGAVLGTINYMSPEQARGNPAGPASDIFSIGTVLFEMLTGKRPFERETAPETMTAILREDAPEVSSADHAVGPAIQRIVQRCLEKQPEERFQSAHDLAFALETSSGLSTGAQPVADVPLKRSRRLAWWPAVAALAVGLVAGAFLNARFNSPVGSPPVKTAPITFSGFDANPTASPDGRTVAFASRRGDVPGIWVKQLTGGGEARLTSGADDNPRFSPDGSSVLFARREPHGNSIYRVPLVGGEPRKLIDRANEADWSMDGSQVVFTRFGADGNGSLGMASSDGSGERTILEQQDRVFSSPRWSPDGKTVAFLSATTNNTIPFSVMLIDVDSGTHRELAPKRPSVSGVTWSGSGEHLVFGWSEDLLSGLASTAVRISMQDVDSGETTDLFWSRNLLRNQAGTRIDIAGSGKVVFGTIDSMQSLHETALHQGGGREEARTLATGNSISRQPVYAPDGETILFSSNRSGNLDLWTVNTRSGAVRQLTDDEARDWDPAYVGDGSKIVWSSDRGGNLEIWIANADGSGARQVSQDGVGAENPTATPDGEWIVYMTSNPDKAGVWKVRADGSESTQLWQGSGFIPEVSPDGRHVAFVLSEGSNVNRMHVLDLATGVTSPFSVGLSRGDGYGSNNMGRSRWFNDGKSIAFLVASGSEIGLMVQDFVPGRDTTATQRKLAGFDPEWFSESFDVSPDGTRVVLSRLRPGGTVMMAENVPHIEPQRSGSGSP